MNVASQPNIVFVMADQLAAGFLGCYGSGVESTPTLDRLASEGARFERCYAHCPVCAPNRATIFTGRSIGVHGVVTNNYVLQPDNPTFAMKLRQAGYRTGGFGKFHLTPMQWPLPESFDYLGFDESVPTEDPKLGPWLDWVEREHPEYYEQALAVSWPMSYITEYGPQRRNLLPLWEEVNARIREPLRRASDWRLMHASPLPADLHQTTYITDLGLDFMTRHLRRTPDRPFCCFISYVDPHDPYDPPAPYDEMFAPEDMPLPIPMQGDRYASETLEAARDMFDFRAVADRPRVMRQLRARYHGSIKFIDDQLARLVRFLDEKGIADNTIVVFTTDHGDMMGDHGFITKGVMHYDSGIRCPLIVRGARTARGLLCHRLVSSLDFFPTFCKWAGVQQPPPLEGKSFADACLDGNEESGWETVTVQAPQADVRSIVTRDGWRFTVFNEPGQGQMFYLRNDPQEQNNLYREPKWARQRVKLHEALTRAYMQPLHVEQYRNLPEREGCRYTLSRGLRPLVPVDKPGQHQDDTG